MGSNFIVSLFRRGALPVVVLLTGGVVAYAVIPPNSQGVIEACYNTARGTLRLLVSPGDACHSGETAIQFLGGFAKAVDADRLDGHDSTYYTDAANLVTGTLSVDRLADGSITNGKLQNSSVSVQAGVGLSGGGAIPLGGSATLTNTGVLSLHAVAPLSSTGGQDPTLSLGIVPADKGGTGLSLVGPAGNVLRSDGSAWTSSRLQASDMPPGSLSGLVYVSVSSGVSSTSYKDALAMCPPGKTIIGGGAGLSSDPAQVDATYNALALSDSRPHVVGSASGWYVDAHEVNPTPALWEVVAYAICASAAD